MTDISNIEDNFDRAIQQEEFSPESDTEHLPYTGNPYTDLPHAENQEAANNIDFNKNIINNNKKEEGGERERADAFPESDSEEELMNEKMEFEEGVFLTINEFEKLEKLYGEDGVLDVIERYSLYKKNKKKSYSDDFLTLYRWFERDKSEKLKLFERKN